MGLIVPFSDTRPSSLSVQEKDGGRWVEKGAPVTDQLLMTTPWLAEHLGDSNLRIVDIRGHVIPASEPPPHYFNHLADYEKSHIPGAVFVDWVHEITDPADPRHAKIARPERFADVMSRIGIAPDTLVVTYDDRGSMFAARLWWALHYYGHHRVAVLDGGWQKWIAENRPTTALVPDIKPTAFTPRPDSTWYRSGDQVARALRTSTRLLDMRSTSEYNGESSRAPRKGHIPGALHLSRSSLLAPNQQLLALEQIREKFHALGIDENTPEVIFYCNAGVSASFGLLAMRVARLNVTSAVYDGSWKDWANDATRPIE
jgi:thiosulfate/3-mercaptopyruvate sulfurtransferase